MSEQTITNINLKNWLKDFDIKSKTEVLDNGSEKEEIMTIAKAKMGIDLKDNTDLSGFKTVYTFADIANGDGQRIPKERLLKALPTLIGKAVNINHNRQYVIGYYIDYRYIQSENKVIAYGIIFKSNFGEEWEKAKRLLKEGKLGTSHEVWSPKNSRKYLGDGTFEVAAIEFAGGALIYMDEKDPKHPNRNIRPSHDDCNDYFLLCKEKKKNMKLKIC